jgi:histone H3/H4
VQETVLQLAQQPEASFEQPNLVQALTMEAFEAAVQSNFPSDALRPELREASEGGGQWRLMPSHAGRKWYKKYTRVFDVTIDPSQMSRVTTFAGVTLGDMLGATTSAVTTKPLKGRLHLYELSIGSRLVDIARLEKNVPGLGNYNWPSWRRIMPLTPEAAALLLPPGASGLGRNPGLQFLQGPYLTAPGQRFYHLELTSDVVAPAPKSLSPVVPGTGTKPAASGSFNDVGVIFNLIRGAITVKMRISEATAQEIATYLRRNDFSTPVQLLRRVFGAMDAMRQGQLKIGFRVEGEASSLQEYLEAAQQNENFLPQAAIARLAGKVGQELLAKLAGKLFDALWNAVAKYIASKSSDFIAATENPAQGVTILLAFNGITTLQRYREIRDGKLASGVTGFLADKLKGLAMPITALPFPTLAIRPGMQ